MHIIWFTIDLGCFHSSDGGGQHEGGGHDQNDSDSRVGMAK